MKIVIEPASSSRSKCQVCKEKILQGTYRLVFPYRTRFGIGKSYAHKECIKIMVNDDE